MAFEIHLKRERHYHVKIIDEPSGNVVLDFAGVVVSKRQSAGILGLSKTVEESLFVSSFDVTFGSAFKDLFLSRLLETTEGGNTAPGSAPKPF